MMSAPASARAMARAAPMLRVAPVRTAVLPARLKSSGTDSMMILLSDAITCSGDVM